MQMVFQDHVAIDFQRVILLQISPGIVDDFHGLPTREEPADNRCGNRQILARLKLDLIFLGQLSAHVG
jgi:hypothetical protein